jgi:hypothetical protein
MIEMQNAYKMLVRKSEGKKPFVILELRWEDVIKIYYKTSRMQKCGQDSSGSE